MSLLKALDLILRVVYEFVRENIASIEVGFFLTPESAFDLVGLINVWQRQLLEINVNE